MICCLRKTESMQAITIWRNWLSWEKKMKLKRILFTILQCTWGIIQTFLGAVIFIKLRKYPHMRYRGCVDTRWNISSGLSLGLFIFTPGEEDEDSQKIRVHEYGHCIQSIVLGPFYMLLGIISIVWARHPYFERIRREKNLPYTACFVEAWASRWGEAFTGESAIWN